MGWIGSFLIIAGAWGIGHRWRRAFLLTMSGGVCWAAQGVILGRWDIIFIETVMFCVAARNFRKWGVKLGRAETALKHAAENGCLPLKPTNLGNKMFAMTSISVYHEIQCASYEGMPCNCNVSVSKKDFASGEIYMVINKEPK